MLGHSWTKSYEKYARIYLTFFAIFYNWKAMFRSDWMDHPVHCTRLQYCGNSCISIRLRYINLYRWKSCGTCPTNLQLVTLNGTLLYDVGDKDAVAVPHFNGYVQTGRGNVTNDWFGNCRRGNNRNIQVHAKGSPCVYILNSRLMF